ncbi:unnamed protein product [Peronospora destructor]|uniref:Programmed cell death protein 2 C-terminal domain-containing protein n=1 Tax=Peronospora destructor TaxID=86335 RepID=A0AAV0V5V0_9STRA|nr:unnamed protein product [Peronospora destructor]
MEERVVLLGSIQERQSVDNSSPYVCKAGGTPAWYSKPPSEAVSLTCSNCCNGLFLVAQVYAPVEIDRTLYVFGERSFGFGKIDNVTEQIKVAWGLESDDSDWSDDQDDCNLQTSAADLVDLEALLQQRDDAMKKSTKTTNQDRNAFSALLIEVIDEPYEDYTGERDFAHENQLLEEYMKQEEVAKSTEIEDLRNVMTNVKKKQGAGQSSNAASSTGESYEKTPANQRHLLRFQKRISRCPLQCLRYDYGGEPLWPVVVPKDLKVPHCPGCGQERTFEMQLTPTINYFLKVDEYPVADTFSVKKTTISTSNGTCKAVVPAGGMDWLSLIVYSCSTSCAPSHEEFIYVVPSMSEGKSPKPIRATYPFD